MGQGADHEDTATIGRRPSTRNGRCRHKIQIEDEDAEGKKSDEDQRRLYSRAGKIEERSPAGTASRSSVIHMFAWPPKFEKPTIEKDRRYTIFQHLKNVTRRVACTRSIPNVQQDVPAPSMQRATPIQPRVRHVQDI